MKRVLLVDDREPVRSGLARTLRRTFSVAIAAGADAALKLLEEERFDAILTDHDMPPGPDGLWLLREVERRWPHTRRFLMTGEPRRLASHIDPAVAEVVFQKPLTASDFVAAFGRDGESAP